MGTIQPWNQMSPSYKLKHNVHNFEEIFGNFHIETAPGIYQNFNSFFRFKVSKRSKIYF